MQREISTTVLATALDYFLFRNESKASYLYSTTMQQNSTFKSKIYLFRNPKTPETHLLEYLKRKSDYYGTFARPVKDRNDNVTLYYGLRLIQVGVDEVSNTLTTSVWIRHVSLGKEVVSRNLSAAITSTYPVFTLKRCSHLSSCTNFTIRPGL